MTTEYFGIEDLGTSTLKSWWACDGHGGWEIRSPLVRTLSSESRYNDLLEQYESTFFKSTLIKYKDARGTYSFREVGMSVQGSGNILHYKDKDEEAIAKTLASIGHVLTEKVYLGSEDVLLTLNVFLPRDEYVNRQKLCENLKTAIESGFWYNGKLIESIKINNKISAVIEGYGLSLPLDPADNTPVVNRGVLLVGYADMAWLRFGVASNLSSIKPGLGMVSFLSLLQECKLDFTLPADLIVAKALYEGNLDLITTDAKSQAKLKAALKQAEQQFCYDAEINNLNFQAVESAIAGGGTGKFLFDAIKKHVKTASNLELPDDLVREITRNYPSMPESLAYLFTDSWQIFKRMQLKNGILNMPKRSSKSSIPVPPATVYKEVVELEDWDPSEALREVADA